MYFVCFYSLFPESSFSVGSFYVNDLIAKTETQKEKREPITLAFVGDIMMDRGVRSVTNIHGGGEYDYITKYLDFLNDYDIVFGNLEGPASDLGYDLNGKYSFRMAPKVIESLKKVNFSVLSVANNHAGDWGRDAFMDTVNRLKIDGVKVVGGGINYHDAERVSVVEVNDYTVGFVGFSDIGPDWLEAGVNTPGILLARSSYHDEVISRASEEVDFLVVSYHFGEEYQSEANSRQRFLAKKAIEKGADAVIGHHPHVVQPIEIYKKGIIAYSLGNFIFDQNFSTETMEGMLLVIDIDEEKVNFQTEKIEISPHFQPFLRE
jgi:poly-gamma-glutamate synthesis protein (capsule biosynthesis protein)